MKKYFYYVAQFQTGDNFRIKNTMSGVCESKDDGLFPIVEAISDVALSAKSHPAVSGSIDVMAIRVVNVVEISKDDYLMMNYDEINGNDAEK